MPQFLPSQGSGKADAANIVVSGKARFSILGPGLIRLEYAENGIFEDRASWFAAARNMPKQDFSQAQEGPTLLIKTGRLKLEYKAGSGPFSASNLSITVLAQGDRLAAVWRPGQAPTGNLGGTLRTLDEVEGPRDLGLGLLSRDGWALIDDSSTVLFTDEELPWAVERPKTGNVDWYFFGYQLDYPAALADLCRIGGKIPLPPKFALGSWYSRYWPYTSDEFLEIADQYKKEGFPLEVMVIDMDWHEDGWTGYTWNQKLIPDPKALLKQLHERGLKVTLNLHPHDGVGPHEACYKDFIKAMGLPAESAEAIPFDITDHKFAEHYFSVLLNPLEKDGVDFWWMDWQQGSKTKVEGLDPLMWLNYLHFRDRQKPVDNVTPRPAQPDQAGPADDSRPRPSRRGMNFSRWAGLGDHRHPVHFSGDTHSNWEILEFLSPFTATAGNVGAAYWSHDMGGHFATAGRTDPELFTRWIQFGAFSPVLRVHSTRDKDNDRRPWLYGEPYASAVRQAYVLRDQLMPYLYTTARQCYDTGLGLLRPMYLQYPTEADAYGAPNQFMLGQDILVAPASRPGNGRAKVAQVAVWFPEGDWYHLLTHQRFQGPLHTVLSLGLEDMAAFARGGAPIPMKGNRIRLYPGAAAERELYEDDGESSAYEQGQFRRTALSSRVVREGQMEFKLGPSQGAYAGASAARPAYSLEFPAGLAGPSLLKGGALDEPVSAAVHAAFGDGLRELYDRVTWQAQKAALALRQLSGTHALHPQLKDLSQRLGHLIELFQGPEDRAGFEKVAQTIQSKWSELLSALSGAGDAESESALRVMAGVSMLALAKPGPDPSAIVIELELRRELPLGGPCSVKVKVQGEAEPGRKHFELAPRCLNLLQLPWGVAFGELYELKGEVEARLELDGVTVLLHEPFEWKAGTIRQWLVLGPLEKGTLAALPQIPEAFEAKIAYPKLGGGEARWQALRFDPAGMMRGIREFYDFKDAFLCPKGECLALACIVAEEPTLAEFGFGHEGQAELWINGEAVKPEQGTFSASLKAGDNLVAVKLSNLIRQGGGFGISLKKSSSRLRFKTPEMSAEKSSAGIS